MTIYFHEHTQSGGFSLFNEMKKNQHGFVYRRTYGYREFYTRWANTDPFERRYLTNQPSRDEDPGGWMKSYDARRAVRQRWDRLQKLYPEPHNWYKETKTIPAHQDKDRYVPERTVDWINFKNSTDFENYILTFYEPEYILAKHTSIAPIASPYNEPYCKFAPHQVALVPKHMAFWFSSDTRDKKLEEIREAFDDQYSRHGHVRFTYKEHHREPHLKKLYPLKQYTKHTNKSPEHAYRLYLCAQAAYIELSIPEIPYMTEHLKFVMESTASYLRQKATEDFTEEFGRAAMLIEKEKESYQRITDRAFEKYPFLKKMATEYPFKESAAIFNNLKFIVSLEKRKQQIEKELKQIEQDLSIYRGNKWYQWLLSEPQAREIYDEWFKYLDRKRKIDNIVSESQGVIEEYGEFNDPFLKKTEGVLERYEEELKEYLEKHSGRGFPTPPSEPLIVTENLSV